MPREILHFTVGPVQGFIAEARRTRDLWAGSFLLSWLTGKAMRSVEEVCGEDAIRLPCLKDDRFYRAIRGEGGTPYVATLPNHFKALVPAGFDPDAHCTRVIQAEWRALAEAVWDRFLSETVTALGPVQEKRTRRIWGSQIGTDSGDPPFWECAWVMAPEAEVAGNEDLDWLDMRKTWRTHLPPVQEGDGCTVMGGWQEISGWRRYREREEQEKFWQALQRGVASKVYGRTDAESSLELQPGERLCAIALVRRLFPNLEPHALEKTIGWVPGVRAGDEGARAAAAVHRAIELWPSTSYMAAVRWLEVAHELAPDACRTYAGTVAGVSGMYAKSEQGTAIGCLKGAGEIAGLDGNMFFRNSIENPRVVRLEPSGNADAPAAGESAPAAERRRELLRAFDALHDAIDRAARERKRRPPGRPAPFYAVLRMDGDSMGKLSHEDPEDVSAALAVFSGGVDEIVERNNGVTIFAGGDDALALLPLEDALPAAAALRERFRAAFGGRPDATISAAIVYAHRNAALRWVLEESRKLLEGVAKDANGRDSIAIAVMRPGGTGPTWVGTWTDAAGRGLAKALAELLELSLRDRDNPEKVNPLAHIASNQFVYRLHARYQAFFFGPDRGASWQPGIERGAEAIIDSEKLANLFRYEIAAAPEKAVPDALARHAAEMLVTVARRTFRDPVIGAITAMEPPVAFDALLLLRFLHQSWRGKIPASADAATGAAA